MNVHSEITFIALVVVVALLCGMAMLRLKLPALIGYILAGVVLGPSGFGLVEDRDQINLLAELGVLMLLFLIGLELSLRAFKTVWRIALLGTGLQIGGALAAMLLFSLVLGWPLELAMLLGFVVALSSTAVSVKMLEEIGALRSRVGRIMRAASLDPDMDKALGINTRLVVTGAFAIAANSTVAGAAAGKGPWAALKTPDPIGIALA